MLLIYNIGVRLYFFAVYIASLFNKKAKLWINGRKNLLYAKYNQSVWFHFASLGEFEQGRSVLELIKTTHPEKKIVITFFSPSGYEIRKNTPLADAVYYLPLDTPENARDFIDTIQPSLVIFTKYEYWYHYFNELNKRKIPLYVISGIFRPRQIFFKWYGDLHRKMLTFVTEFFVQDEASKQLLQTIGITNAQISGDTRFDRVWENARETKPLPIIEQFKMNQKVFIAGSTWPDDEKLLITLLNDYADWKFIFAPHEIGEQRINKLMEQFAPNSAVKYSDLLGDSRLLTVRHQVLVIDNIGMLSALYQYGGIAYIGGGFGVGIHNTLEAAAFGIPVIFGPNYSKFKEARDLVELKCGFSINDEPELKSTLAYILEDEPRYEDTCERTKQYVENNTGATDIIINSINII